MLDVYVENSLSCSRHPVVTNKDINNPINYCESRNCVNCWSNSERANADTFNALNKDIIIKFMEVEPV